MGLSPYGLVLSGRIQNHDEVVTLPSATQPLTSSLSVILHPPYDFGPFLHFEPPAQFPCHLFGNREVPQSHPMHCLTRIPRYIVHSHHTEALLGDTAITGHPVTVSEAPCSVAGSGAGRTRGMHPSSSVPLGTYIDPTNKPHPTMLPPIPLLPDPTTSASPTRRY